ncbi:YwbE family protein [Methanolacinia paynteri]|uniref:YwbE family protein n=1 Tax=Methanolacinia paynteri TaxID=230356 RepID=UPI00064FE8F2|nr:YwbE family protein [Methanolacinia paynteri]
MGAGKDPRDRKNIDAGAKVGIVLKKDQKSGKTTEGIVKEILTNSSFHPHGIKVRLEDGQVGRVKVIFGE